MRFMIKMISLKRCGHKGGVQISFTLYLFTGSFKNNFVTEKLNYRKILESFCVLP